MSDSPIDTEASAAVASTDQPDAGLFRRSGAKKKSSQSESEGDRRAATFDAGTGGGESGQQLHQQGSGDPCLLEYSMKSKKRGYCIIINQVVFYPETGQSERAGSDVDADNLERTFRRLRFDVTPYRNLTCKEIDRVMRDVAKKDHKDRDCIAIVILSHGEDGCIYGADGKLPLEKLARLLRADRCPTLAGKPKLLFVQACRGSEFDRGHTVYESTDGGDDHQDGGKLSRIPLESDFLFFYSTPPGYYSWRNDADGSWFVQQLCRVLQEYGDQQIELCHLLLTVQRLVASEFQSRTGDQRTSGMKQIPVTVSTLRKLLYFRH